MNATALLLFIFAAIFAAVATGFGVEAFDNSSTTHVTPTLSLKANYSSNVDKVHIEYGKNASNYDVIFKGDQMPTLNNMTTWMGLFFREVSEGTYKLEGHPVDGFSHDVVIGNDTVLKISADGESSFRAEEITIQVGSAYAMFPHGPCKDFDSRIPGMEWDKASRSLRGTPTRSGKYYVMGRTVFVTEATESSSTSLDIGIYDSVNEDIVVGLNERFDYKMLYVGKSYTLLNPGELPKGLKFEKKGRIVGVVKEIVDSMLAIRVGNTFNHVRIRVVPRLSIESGWIPKGFGLMIDVRGYKGGTMLTDQPLPPGLKVAAGVIYGTVQRNIPRTKVQLKAYTNDGQLSAGTVTLHSNDTNEDFMIVFIVATVTAVAFLAAAFYAAFVNVDPISNKG